MDRRTPSDPAYLSSISVWEEHQRGLPVLGWCRDGRRTRRADPRRRLPRILVPGRSRCTVASRRLSRPSISASAAPASHSDLAIWPFATWPARAIRLSQSRSKRNSLRVNHLRSYRKGKLSDSNTLLAVANHLLRQRLSSHCPASSKKSVEVRIDNSGTVVERSALTILGTGHVHGSCGGARRLRLQARQPSLTMAGERMRRTPR